MTTEPVFDHPIPQIDVDALPPDDPLFCLRRANEELRASEVKHIRHPRPGGPFERLGRAIDRWFAPGF
jgi:hypothetical protein